MKLEIISITSAIKNQRKYCRIGISSAILFNHYLDCSAMLGIESKLPGNLNNNFTCLVSCQSLIKNLVRFTSSSLSAVQYGVPPLLVLICAKFIPFSIKQKSGKYLNNNTNMSLIRFQPKIHHKKMCEQF